MKLTIAEEEFIEWEDGKLTASRKEILSAAKNSLENYTIHERPVGQPTGPTITSDYLANPYSAYWFLKEVFPTLEVEEATDDEIEEIFIPPLSEDTIH